MAVLVCENCGNSHHDYSLCSDCLSKNGLIERNKAYEDAVALGVGFCRITVDGGWERIDPSTIKLKEPDQVEKNPPQRKA